MAVYVDWVQRMPTTIRCFKPGFCHLMADTEQELHDFAKRLGLRREWFQPRERHPHYDLTLRRREVAIRLGAIEVDRDFYRKALDGR